MKSTTYSEKTLDHFRNPRNVGVLEGDDVAVGRVGNPVCGDLMEMYVRIKDDRIEEITFQTFGCGSAVATSSMITELVIGMTLDEALEVTRTDVADALDGLPPVKMHCSNLAADALHNAIDNWRSGTKLEPLEDVPEGAGCGAREVVVVGKDEYAGKGVYAQADVLSDFDDKRTLVVDSGDESAELAIALTERTGRVIFLTTGKVLSLSGHLGPELKRSDVKILYESQLLEIGGEGLVEKVRVHDLNEDEEYELFVDAVVMLES